MTPGRPSGTKAMRAAKPERWVRGYTPERAELLQRTTLALCA